MLFGKNKVSLEQMREEDPKAYNELMDKFKSKADEDIKAELEAANKALESATNTIGELEAKAERKQIDDKIIEFGSKLGVDKEAKVCIEKEMSFVDALESMVNSHADHLKKVADSFDDTASEPVGDDGGEDVTSQEPENFGEAIVAIKKRDDCSAEEAAEKAKVEYKELFDAQYDNIAKVEETE